MAFINSSEDETIGPLSEWVPGTVTAVALTYALVTQRRADERQRALDTTIAEQARRAQAEKVYVWIERRQRPGVQSQDTCIVRWSNVIDGPAYRCRFTRIFPDGTEQDGAIGTIPPQHRVDEDDTGYTIAAGAKPTKTDRFPVGLRCEFEDAENRTWQRDPSGKLSG